MVDESAYTALHMPHAEGKHLETRCMAQGPHRYRPSSSKRSFILLFLSVLLTVSTVFSKWTRRTPRGAADLATCRDAAKRIGETIVGLGCCRIRVDGRRRSKIDTIGPVGCFVFESPSELSERGG